MEKNSIIFVCSAGDSIGLGHFKRTLSICNEFYKNNYDTKLIVIGKNLKHLKKHTSRALYVEKNYYRFVYNYSKKKKIKNVFFDLSAQMINNQLLNFLKKNYNYFNFFGLDQLYKLNRFFKIFIISNPVIKRIETNVYSGIKYCFFKKKIPSKKIVKNQMTIVIGSSKNANYFIRLIKVIRNFSTISNLRLLVGPYIDLNFFKKKIYKKKIKIYRNLKTIDNVLIKSEYVVCTYGTAFFEILKMGKICILLDEMKKENREAISYFRRKNFCYVSKIEKIDKTLNDMYKNSYKKRVIKSNLFKINKYNSANLVFKKISRYIINKK